MTGSAVQLTSTPYEASMILLRSHRSNLGLIYIGPSGITNLTGYEAMAPGESFTIENSTRITDSFLDIQPHMVYVVGNSGDHVGWLGWVR